MIELNVTEDAPIELNALSDEPVTLGVSEQIVATYADLSPELKQAFLNLAEHIAYIDADGQDYYDALYNALYPVEPPAELDYITAVYTQSGTVYDTDSLDSLKSDLVVTATYSDSTTETVPGTDYTLSGTLTAGTSTITVSYGGKSTNFNVEVVHDSTVQIATEGAFLAHYKSGGQDIYEEKTKTNTGVTIKYPMDSPTAKLNPAGIIPSDAPSTLYKDNCYACLFVYDASQNPVNFVNELSNNTFNRWVQNAAGTMTEYSNSWTLASQFSYIAFSVDMRYIDDAYMYDATTGQVWFAGINTPYYGMSNISEAQP